MFDRYTKLFCIGYALSIVALIVLSIILGMMFNVDIPSSASIATILGGTIFAAGKYAEEVGEAPSSQLSWTYAWRWSFLSLLISAVMMAGMLMVLPEIAAVILQNLLIFVIVFAVVFGIVALCIRFTFPSFVKSQLKAIEKKKQRK